MTRAAAEDSASKTCASSASLLSCNLVSCIVLTSAIARADVSETVLSCDRSVSTVACKSNIRVLKLAPSSIATSRAPSAASSSITKASRLSRSSSVKHRAASTSARADDTREFSSSSRDCHSTDAALSALEHVVTSDSKAVTEARSCKISAVDTASSNWRESA